MRRACALAAIASALAIAPRIATADCEPPKIARHELAVQAVFLGDFPDLLGHHAAWFWDQVGSAILGPLDRDPWPDSHARAVPAPAAQPGDTGTLHLTAWVEDPARPGAVSGWFVSFAPDGQHSPLAPIIAQLPDWYLLGALVSQKATFDDADRRVHALLLGGNGADHATRAVAAMIATMPAAAAWPEVGSFHPHSLGGADAATVLALHGDLPSLARMTPAANPYDWSEYLPVLAAAKRPDLRDALDDAMLGHATPVLPPALDGDPPLLRHSCGPTRAQLRGPSLAGEVSAADVLALLRLRDPRLASRVVAAFAGIAAGSGYIVGLYADGGKHVAVVAAPGALTALAITPAQAASLALGARVDYVAHAAAPGATYARPPLDPAASVIELRTATRLRVAAIDPPAAIAAVQSNARSGELSGMVAASLAQLFELADHMPGWTLADARTYLHALPGNAYDTPEQWAQAWHDALVDAVVDAPTTLVADELESSLPALFARFAGRPPQPPLPALVVRALANEVESAVALRRLAAGDVAGARAAIARAAGPLAALAGVTPVGHESPQDDNPTLVRQTIGALADALAKEPVALPAASTRSQAMNLLRETLRPYAPALRESWLRTLVAAGMPKT